MVDQINNSTKIKNQGLVILLILMLFLFLVFSGKNNVVDAATPIHLKLDATTGGTATITYTNSEGIDVSTNDVTFTSKTQIRLTETAMEGYRFVCWTYETKKGTISYDNFIFVVTPSSSYNFVAVFCKTDDVIVRFYNSLQEDSTNYLLSLQILNEDVTINTHFDKPTKRGFALQGWSTKDGTEVTLSSINKDVDLTPIFNATVFSIAKDYSLLFLKGLGITLALSIVSVVLAIALGLVLCFMRISGNPILKFISTAYVEIIRGIPILLQLLLIYTIFPRISIGFLNTEVLACLCALFINSGAYQEEIYRAGIEAVDIGQSEAGRALGLSKLQVLFKIVLPQGIKNSLPSLGNELIAVIKETSLASTVDASIGELMSVKIQITSYTFSNIPPYIVIAIIYFIVTFSLSKGVRFIERRLKLREQR